VQVAQQRLRRGPSALQRRAAGCVIHDGVLILLDANCLTRG